MKKSKFLTRFLAVSAAAVMALTSFSMPAKAEENGTVTETVSENVEDDSEQELSCEAKVEFLQDSFDAEYSAANEYKGAVNLFQLVDGEKFNVVKYMNLNKKDVKKFEVTVSDNAIKTKVSRSGKVSKIKRGIIGITAIMKDQSKSQTLYVDAYKPKKVKLNKTTKKMKIGTFYELDNYVEGLPCLINSEMTDFDKHFDFKGVIVFPSLGEKMKSNSNPLTFMFRMGQDGKQYIALVSGRGPINYKIKSISMSFLFRNDQELADGKKAKKKIKVSGLKVEN